MPRAWLILMMISIYSSMKNMQVWNWVEPHRGRYPGYFLCAIRLNEYPITPTSCFFPPIAQFFFHSKDCSISLKILLLNMRPPSFKKFQAHGMIFFLFVTFSCFAKVLDQCLLVRASCHRKAFPFNLSTKYPHGF